MVRVEEKSSFRTTEMRCWLGVSFSPLGENQEMSLYLASPATRDNNKKKAIWNEFPANIQGIKDNQEHYVEYWTKGRAYHTWEASKENYLTPLWMVSCCPAKTVLVVCLFFIQLKGNNFISAQNGLPCILGSPVLAPPPHMQFEGEKKIK